LRAYIVVDLGFGDAGKGLLTDFLVRHLNAGLVVRYNGGAQAGHNVVAPDRRQHTFSQFGSGTFFPGVKTYLSKYVVVHPTALLVEGDILISKGIRDAFSRIRVSDQALVITPFHQAANRIREIVRGGNRHGSCGVGVGEAVEDALAYPEDSILAGDLSNLPILARKLRSIRERKRQQLAEQFKDNSPDEALAREWLLFEDENVIKAWISSVSRFAELGLVAPEALLQGWLQQEKAVIFEGAQGVLLDQDAGFHPYTTWSRCTAANAHEIINGLAPETQVFQIGVMRCYAVRHGPGPLPSETDSLKPFISEHNQYNPWQGAVRYGWFDAVLARYALGLTSPLDSLLVTHLDLLPHLQTWRYCPGYTGQLDFDRSIVETTVEDVILSDFHPAPVLSLEQRTQITQAIAKVTPLLEACDANEGKVIQKIESLTGQSVGMVSQGPGANDVKVLNDIPT
jgi:adenylosuccinate synthase